jgi:hypothetical protein
LINQHLYILSEVADLVKLFRASLQDGDAVDDSYRLIEGAEALAHNIKEHEQKERVLF